MKAILIAISNFIVRIDKKFLSFTRKGKNFKFHDLIKFTLLRNSKPKKSQNLVKFLFL